MAITVTPKVTGQVANGSPSYCYLYEPLEVEINVNPVSKSIFIDMEVLNTGNINVADGIFPKYAEYDVDSNNTKIKVDLMELVRQFHDANLYKIANISELISTASSSSNYSSVSKFVYNMQVYTDDVPTKIDLKKIPIIGGRGYKDFTPSVATDLTATTEFEILGLDFSNRWKNYPIITSTFANPSGTALLPTINVVAQTQGKEPCGGFVVWKSKYGGWCQWGFDLKNEKNNHKYVGNIDVGMFEANSNGKTYIEANYTGIDTSYSISLKSLSLTKTELQGVSGIQSSPAIYLVKKDGSAELMRLGSASVPLDSKARGGDFSITLKSISKSMQTTR